MHSVVNGTGTPKDRNEVNNKLSTCEMLFVVYYKSKARAKESI